MTPREFFDAVREYAQKVFATPETRDAKAFVDRIEAAIAQGGGAVVLPDGREVIVHAVPRGRLDVGSRPVGYAFGSTDAIDAMVRSTKLEPPAKVEPAKPLAGSYQDRLAKAKQR